MYSVQFSLNPSNHTGCSEWKLARIEQDGSPGFLQNKAETEKVHRRDVFETLI